MLGVPFAHKDFIFIQRLTLYYSYATPILGLYEPYRMWWKVAFMYLIFYLMLIIMSI